MKYCLLMLVFQGCMVYSGLAFDRNSKRLFAGCDKLLVVMDATNGRVINKLPIGDGCDGVAFDNSIHTIFTSNGEGTLTVIRENAANAFAVAQTLTTKRGARTITLDESSHTLFLPTADYGAPPAQGGRAPVVPGSFQVLVVKSEP